jgi:hypothetical protein
VRVSSRSEFLAQLWREVINAQLDHETLQNEIAASKRKPDNPFADTGPALERLLALGAAPQDICLVRRSTAYEAVFATLYALDNPGVNDQEAGGLYEDLLGADPSGLDGRPGSARAV